MSLLGEVVRHLEREGIDAAIIGGLALAAHGIARATLDADLLVVNKRVLDEEFWSDRRQQATVRTLRGDVDDPLAGAVRLERGAEAVDVVVTRAGWQRGALERRITLTVDGELLPVVRRVDLVLLKLWAGGPQDKLDVRLLYLADRTGLTQELDPLLIEVPADLRQAWEEVRHTS